jgi:hypothetical protein
MIAKVSLGFARISDTELDNFAQAVVAGMTGNVTFPDPPVMMATLQTAIEEFSARVSAAQLGGPVASAAKNNSRGTLIGILRLLAAYVHMSCNGDLVLLLGSGFEAQGTKGASVPLDRPLGLTIKNGGTGQLLARVNPVKNRNMYEGRLKLDGSDWLPSVFASDSKRIAFEGLTPGQTYTIQVRALGGSTGYSDWSDPSSHMAM